MSAVCIIPARAGSQRIPNKNIKEFMGKPIICYSIEAAIKSEIFDEVIVSTDSEMIAKIAEECGAERYMRSSILSQNDIGTQQVTKDVLNHIGEYEFACCLYATVPMIEQYELRRALSFLRFNNQIQYVVPVGEWLSDPGRWYFGRANAFTTGIPLLGMGTRLMEVDPRKCIDINTPEDWAEAEKRYEDMYL